MKDRDTNHYLTGYFTGQLTYSFIRLLFTFPGITAAAFMMLYVFLYPHFKINEAVNWSTTDLKYLKSDHIPIQEKCEQWHRKTGIDIKVKSSTGRKVQEIMCSPARRWEISEKDKLHNIEDPDLRLARRKWIDSTYFQKLRWEKRNPKHPDILKSNELAPLPAYSTETGKWTIPNEA